MNILITGANGFIGTNLVAQLKQTTDHNVFQYDRTLSPNEQSKLIAKADFVFHLAGVNRPSKDEDFKTANVEFTSYLCQHLGATGRQIPLVFASSTQAAMDNAYGLSKRQAEEVIREYVDKTESRAAIYRLPNVFGKWSQPNYNSVVATFCHNIARDLPITISDPARQLSLVYIDDVVDSFLKEIDAVENSGAVDREVSPLYHATLGELAESIQTFRQMRTGLHIPELSGSYIRKLYATYLSYLERDDLAYPLEQRVDPRGSLAEFIKAPGFGQIFVSRTKPGITRGNHFHHTKTEKFLVLEGQAIIRLQHIVTDEYVEYSIQGEEYRVVDIPPGYTHSIENIGDCELVTLFWASEIFEPAQPDTYFRAIVEAEA